jgi:hypothetical protein
MAVIVIHASLRMARMGMAQWGKTILRPPFDLLGTSGVGFWKRITATPE